jgi:hypothetical protein
MTAALAGWAATLAGAVCPTWLNLPTAMILPFGFPSRDAGT